MSDDTKDDLRLAFDVFGYLLVMWVLFGPTLMFRLRQWVEHDRRKEQAKTAYRQAVNRVYYEAWEILHT